MIKNTTDFDLFKLREDNREKIDRGHVRRIKSSIECKNMLWMRPISVNKDMEIMDGQHRYLAAKELGVPIYYEMERQLESKDIILMNIAKSWSSNDFLNYYCLNGYVEYLKLQKFMKENDLTLKIALALSMGQNHEYFNKFKLGEYVFDEASSNHEMKICWSTINFIKRINGFSSYTRSSRFWKAMLILIKHHAFELKRWMANLEKMVNRFGPRARHIDYLKLIMDVYNWKQVIKIDLLEDGEERGSVENEREA